MPKTVAFSPEVMRKQMYERVAMPPELLQKALRKLDKKLEAKETKFFSFQGQVVDKVEVEAHSVQLDAADKILKIANAYGRDSDVKRETPGVALEIDSKTGVLRLVIGGGAVDALEDNLHSDDDPRAIGQLEASPEQLSLPAFEPNGHLIPAGDDEEAEPQVIKVRRNGVPTDVLKALLGDG